MKRILIAGNWKMNTDLLEADKLIAAIIEPLIDKPLNTEILVCPPFTNLLPISQKLPRFISLGAQNCHYELSGAYTGEISVKMLKSAGCTYVIIGHSERRIYFFETDELINNKIKTVLTYGMKPVVCIGETLEQRQANLTKTILEKQINIGLKELDELNISELIIAYEPVWAIGTGVTATIEQITETHHWIRNMLINKLGSIGNDTLILYGGSVTKDNAYNILRTDNVNGALIGGASLKADAFLSIINDSERILKGI